MHPVRPRNHKRKHSVRPAMILGFLMLAILTVSIVFQVPTALGESENPLNALWNAIFDLQSKDKHLQAQIDELAADKKSLLTPEPEFVSDPYAVIEIEGAEDGRTLIHITAGNKGPDRAAGVKLTAFYLMPLFEINSIEGNLCEDKSRGIIECTIGTLEQDQENVITVDATAMESGKANTWTVDISTTTDDLDPTNNHVTYDFETSSGKSLKILQVEQPSEEAVAEEPKSIETEQNDSMNSTETEGQRESTSNQTAAESEAVIGSNSSSTSADGSEDGQTSEAQESDEESATDESSEGTSQESGSKQQEDSDESSEKGEGDSSSQP